MGKTEVLTLEGVWLEVSATQTFEHTLGKWLFYTLPDGKNGIAAPSQWRIRNGN